MAQDKTNVRVGRPVMVGGRVYKPGQSHTVTAEIGEILRRYSDPADEPAPKPVSGVISPTNPPEGPTADQLEAMTIEELAAEAERREIEVTRGDGKPGRPVKSDYITALAITEGE